MVKLQFSGIYETAKDIPPRQLMEYYLKGDQAERREAGNEILNRLDAEESERKDKVTLLHFIADFIRCLNSEYQYNTHWLCTRTDLQDEAIKLAKKMYEDWRAKELSAKSAREDIRNNGPYSHLYNGDE